MVKLNECFSFRKQVLVHLFKKFVLFFDYNFRAGADFFDFYQGVLFVFCAKLELNVGVMFLEMLPQVNLLCEGSIALFAPELFHWIMNQLVLSKVRCIGEGFVANVAEIILFLGVRSGR